MKGAYFFVIFFLIFTSAIFFIPTPMFPGDTLLKMMNISTLEYASFLSALINGVVYGLIAWAIFVLAMRKTEKTVPKEPIKRRDKRRK
jgi:large-conductance mechanosensitive channel